MRLQEHWRIWSKQFADYVAVMPNYWRAISSPELPADGSIAPQLRVFLGKGSSQANAFRIPHRNPRDATNARAGALIRYSIYQWHVRFKGCDRSARPRVNKRGKTNGLFGRPDLDRCLFLIAEAHPGEEHDRQGEYVDYSARNPHDQSAQLLVVEGG